MTARRVLVVGAGLAGSRCAESLRTRGFDGELRVVGEEPDLPYERPALSKELLAGVREDVSLRAPAWWEERGIELALGRRVRRVDVAARTADGRPWDALVLATGARARRLPSMPDGVLVLRTLADARTLRRRLRPGGRLVVVGGGVLGCEVATTAVVLGAAVTLVEMGAAPLERVLGPVVGRVLAERLAAAGVDVRLGTRVRRLATDGVELAGGEVLAADSVLVAVGAEPAGGLVGAPGGVETDACGRTPLPRVFACGDVASWYRPSLGRPLRVEHWTSAAGQAAAVASAILGDPRPYDEPPYFWSEIAGLRLQHVGHAPVDSRVRLEGAPDAFVARYLDGRGRLAAVLAANRPDAVAPARRELAEPRVPLAA